MSNFPSEKIIIRFFFTLPPDIKTEVSDNVKYLKKLCVDGLHERYQVSYEQEDDRLEVESLPKELSERLDYELSVIGKTGFNDYFLIVADFMNGHANRVFRSVLGVVLVQDALLLMS